MRGQQTLRLFGADSQNAPLDWAWVESRLESAGTYWVVARSTERPHPRPVWGMWHEDALYLSIGSPTVVAALAADPVVAVHLDSGTEVVIVEGSATVQVTDANLVAAYNRKYDWDYDAQTYGPLQRIEPEVVLSWRTAGWAGRDSFRQTGRWTFTE
jgi:hypothetical protein